ncbi:hypothetical protein CYMTET_48828 [Cymbomonas tetramitiformis]|uniref:Uncharacterized protein n=1 Tax=Cymbomonas tetramitiformis TaxID=36881 RepID=A0AAE0BRL3_9CHLO|nr:hypothetical protein CYMTET_48828 [Cymbomonas tetramitiformis]
MEEEPMETTEYIHGRRPAASSVGEWLAAYNRGSDVGPHDPYGEGKDPYGTTDEEEEDDNPNKEEAGVITPATHYFIHCSPPTLPQCAVPVRRVVMASHLQRNFLAAQPLTYRGASNVATQVVFVPWTRQLTISSYVGSGGRAGSWAVA